MTKSVGIIGLGPMGLRHARAVVRSEQLTLLGGCDLREETGRLLQDLQSNAAFFTDAYQLLTKQPDILVIATNAPSHKEIFMQAAEMGIRRFVIEKPLCTSIEDAHAIKRVSEELGCRVVVNISRRYSELYQSLKKRLSNVEEGPGELRSFFTAFGAGGLGNNGTHFLDLARYLLDKKPKMIIGALDRQGVPNPRGEQFDDPGAYGLILLEDGKRIFLEMGEDFGVAGKMQLLGRYGRVIIDELQRKLTIEARNVEDRSAAMTRTGTPIHKLPGDFDPPLDIIRLAQSAIEEAAGDGEITCGLEEALTVLRLVIGLHLSGESGCSPILYTDVDELASGRTFSFT